MTPETYLKSLRIAWKSKEQDYLYMVSLLRKMEHKPEFPNIPKYNRLWAFVTAGRLIGEDVTEWESLLEKETKRIKQVKEEFVPLIESLQYQAQQAEIKAELVQKRLIEAKENVLA